MIYFTNDYRLAWVNQRRLGTVDLTDDVDAFAANRELGIDALDDSLDRQAFEDLLSGRRGMIKSALMNQSVIAGLGNVYADEILFQAKIHPRTPVESLDHGQFGTLYDCMREVLEKSIAVKADPAEMPDEFLTPHRNSDDPCPRCGGEIERVKVSGRTGYYYPTCQPVP